MEERSKTQAIANKKVPAEGLMVLIKDSIKNTGKWKLGRVESQIKGKDGVLRGFKISTGNRYIHRGPRQSV